MSENQWGIEKGPHGAIGEAKVEGLRISYTNPPRMLLSVDANGTATMPDDLTLDEARSVIEQLVAYLPSVADLLAREA